VFCFRWWQWLLPLQRMVHFRRLSISVHCPVRVYSLSLWPGLAVSHKGLTSYLNLLFFVCRTISPSDSLSGGSGRTRRATNEINRRFGEHIFISRFRIKRNAKQDTSQHLCAV
jgi:hypothetical protein